MIRKARKRDFWPEPPKRVPVRGIRLEPMQVEHIDEVIVLENAGFPIPWSRDAFDYDLNKNHLAHYWVLIKEDKIIGYGGIWLVTDIAHLTTICVEEKWQGKGLGRWLLLKIMQLGEELGAKRFTLEVRETNDPAIHLYKSVGYREVGRRENYYQEIGEDALVMWTGNPPFEE